jgi:hypothetical protein
LTLCKRSNAEGASFKLKGKSVVLVSLSVVLLCAAFGIQSTWGTYLSTSRTVGVYVGSWGEYSFVASGNLTSLTNFNATNIPVNETITVATISGTNVTCQTLENFKNNTQKAGTGSVDVESGSGNLTGFLIAANLNKSDLVYNGPWMILGMVSIAGAIVNETTTRNYLGSNVIVCHTNLTQQDISFYYYYFYSLNFFWFRDSGMLAEATLNATAIVGRTYYYGYEHIIITSNSTVPEFQASLILSLFAVVSTLAVVSAKKSSKGTMKPCAKK